MTENSHKFFANKECRYYPCHEGLKEINCLFCYCPFYMFKDCPGDPKFSESGKKSCVNCTFPHDPDNYDRIMEEIRQRQGTSDAREMPG